MEWCDSYWGNLLSFDQLMRQDFHEPNGHVPQIDRLPISKCASEIPRHQSLERVLNHGLGLSLDITAALSSLGPTEVDTAYVP